MSEPKKAATPTNTHPHMKGAKTISEPKKAATATNTHPHVKGAKGSQDHFRAEEGGHSNEHPPPTSREPKGAAARFKVALRTPTVNLSKPFEEKQRKTHRSQWNHWISLELPSSNHLVENSKPRRYFGSIEK